MDRDHHPEEIIERIGGCGRFQVFLSVMCHLMKLPTVLTMYLMMISIATPSWRCMDDELAPVFNTSLLYGNSTYGNLSVMMYSESNVSKSYSNFKNCRNRNGTKCVNIVYDDEIKSIVSEVNILLKYIILNNMVIIFHPYHCLNGIFHLQFLELCIIILCI